LAFSVVGLVVPWYFNIQYFIEGGNLTPSTFFGAALANPLTTAITIDVYLCAVVFSLWAVAESRRLFSPRPFLYIVLSFAVGLAFAFPLYLARRELYRYGKGQSVA
jgi:hypothetical protein